VPAAAYALTKPLAKYFVGDWARVSTPPPGRMARLSAGSPVTDAGVVNYVMVEMTMTTG
jgi:hypothetical protein